LNDGSNINSETSLGKPWTSRIEREQFGAFSSNCPGRNGDEVTGKAMEKEAEREGRRIRERASDKPEDGPNANNQP
jgi:hypothetical protein